MPRRVSLPGAAELFRATQQANHQQPDAQTPAAERSSRADANTADDNTADDNTADDNTANDSSAAEAVRETAAQTQQASGRVRHDEKITVYVSREELLALEQARLTLRAEYDMAVDRGRIVRAAMAAAMTDLAENGAAAEVVRRLTQS